jgi:hypothetical protein
MKDGEGSIVGARAAIDRVMIGEERQQPRWRQLLGRRKALQFRTIDLAEKE